MKAYSLAWHGPQRFIGRTLAFPAHGTNYMRDAPQLLRLSSIVALHVTVLFYHLPCTRPGVWFEDRIHVLMVTPSFVWN